MKAIISVFTALAMIVLAAFLMVSNPTLHDFSEYVAAQDSNTVTDLFSDLIINNIEEQTTVQNYKVFSIFEYEDERYLGIGYEIFSEADIKGYIHQDDKSSTAASN